MSRYHLVYGRLIAILIALLASLHGALPGAAQSPPATPPAPTAVPTPVPGGTPATGAPPVPSAPPVQVIRPIPFVPSADYLGTVGGNAATLALRGVARAPMSGFEHLVARVFTPGDDDDLNVVFQTPPGLSYRSPAVQAMHGTLLSLVLGSISSLLLLVGAANLALRRRWELPVDEPAMLLLRILAASVAALVSLEVLGLAVELNNALIRTLLAVPLCEPGTSCRPHVFGTLGASFGRLTAIGLLDLDLIELLATLALGIVLLLLFIQHLVRIGLLSVLLAVAPLAFMLWVLPQTRWLARLWTSAFFSTLLAQPLQVLAYLLAAGLLALATPPGQNVPGATIVSILIGLATLGVSLSIPRLLRAGVGALEAPLRAATKTVMLWTLATRLTGAATRTGRRPLGGGQPAPAPGPAVRHQLAPASHQSRGHRALTHPTAVATTCGACYTRRRSIVVTCRPSHDGCPRWWHRARSRPGQRYGHGAPGRSWRHDLSRRSGDQWTAAPLHTRPRLPWHRRQHRRRGNLRRPAARSPPDPGRGRRPGPPGR